MSFKLLHHVIAHLKKKYRCPSCGSRFTNDSVFPFLTTPPDEDGIIHGLFYILCAPCMVNAFVTVKVTMMDTHSKKENGIRMISIDDVLDMRNFLKTWQGDVTELFKK